MGATLVCDYLYMDVLNAEGNVNEVFGRNLRWHRERRGWSQSELARRMVDAGWEKYSQVAVSRTEEGTRAVRLDEALALSQVLGVAMEEFLSLPDVIQALAEGGAALGTLNRVSRGVSDSIADFYNARADLERALEKIRKIHEDSVRDIAIQDQLRVILREGEVALTIEYTDLVRHAIETAMEGMPDGVDQEKG